MTTPDPRGTTRCLFWDQMQTAKFVPQAHWSFDPERQKAEVRRKKRALRTLALKSL